MRQEDHEFKTSLSYIVSLWSRLQKTSLKKKKERKGKSSVKIILHDVWIYMYADRENENNEI